MASQPVRIPGLPMSRTLADPRAACGKAWSQQAFVFQAVINLTGPGMQLAFLKSLTLF